MPFFKHDGHRLAYSVYGEGPRAVVLLPGLLFSQRMHVPLARELAERDNRVITLDLLGHGRSDRPDDMRQYSMQQFAEQTVGLLDHLTAGSQRVHAIAARNIKRGREPAGGCGALGLPGRVVPGRDGSGQLHFARAVGG